MSSVITPNSKVINSTSLKLRFTHDYCVDTTKNCKRSLLERYKKVQFFLRGMYRYLEWTKGRDDNDKECTSNERKTGQI